MASFSAPFAPVVASAMSGHSASAQLRASKMRAASSAPSADGAPRKATTAPRWRASPALRSRTARMACLASSCAAVRKLPLRLPFQAVQTSPVETVQASEAASRIRSAASAAASRPSLGGRLLQLHVGRLRSIEVAVEPAHRIARPISLPFDPSGRRMKGADQGFAEERLEVLQRRVRDHVQKFGNKRSPKLNQGFLGSLRALIAERCAKVEGGV